MVKPNIYTVGGTIQTSGALYVTRQADQELLNLCRTGAFAYILSARQVGKSSLIVRTASQLAKEGILSVIIDLTKIGVKVTSESWYLGLLFEIQRKLVPDIDIVAWWRAHDYLGEAQRLTSFFKDILLNEISAPVIIFFDEIDTTLSLDFTDDFFAAIRYIYNARAYDPEFRRLSFVLIGVASPGDLIADPHRTPFNIGQQVSLTDFSHQEAIPLIEGLGLPSKNAGQILHWVIKWTGGHPYLTQRLCSLIAEQYKEEWTEPEVDEIVAKNFFGKMSEQDNNLQFVRDMLTRRATDKQTVMSTYKDIWLGRVPVRDEEQSRVKSHLKLAGIVSRENGQLVVRNPIYRKVFDLRWIRDHSPVGWWKTIPRYAKIGGCAIVALAIVAFVFAIYAFDQSDKNRKYAAQLSAKADSLRALLDSTIVLKSREESAKVKATEFARQKDVAAVAASESAERERLAREEAVRQTQIAREKEEEARAATRVAIENLSEVERRRRIDIAKKLIFQAQQEQQFGNDELSNLLARQAFLFDRKHAGGLENEIYHALLKTLNGRGGPTQLFGHAFAVKAVACHPDSAWVASGSDDGMIRLWNLEASKRSFTTLVGHASSVRAVTFSPDGKFLASAGDDHHVFLWNLRGNSYQGEPLNAHSDAVLAAAFSPDGNWLATGGADKTVFLWSIRQNPTPARQRIEAGAKIRCVAFSPDGQTLAGAGDDGKIRLWDIRRLDQNPKILQRHKGTINALAFSPKGEKLASAGNDKAVILQDVRELNGGSKILGYHDTYITSLVFSHDGEVLASGSLDGKVLLWKWRGRVEKPSIELDNSVWVWSVAFSHDDQRLVVGCENKALHVWFSRIETLADFACAAGKRNLTDEEWRRYVGADIPHENTCTRTP